VNTPNEEVSAKDTPQVSQPVGAREAYLYYGAEIVFWDRVGHGESSFGHVSANVEGFAYSWGQKKMWAGNISTFMTLNQVFRNGQGLELKLTAAQSLKLQEHLVSYVNTDKDYNLLWRNCTDPVETGLEKLGYNLGCNLTPDQLKAAIINAGLVKKTTDYVMINDLPVCGLDLVKQSAERGGCVEEPTLPASYSPPSDLETGGGGVIGGTVDSEYSEGPGSCWRKDGSFRFGEIYKLNYYEKSCVGSIFGIRLFCSDPIPYVRDGVCSQAIYNLGNPPVVPHPTLVKGRRR
jgi:hypothetical protein